MTTHERYALAAMVRHAALGDAEYWWHITSMRRLAARGLVEVHPEKAHLRRPPYRLTEAGRAAYEARCDAGAPGMRAAR